MAKRASHRKGATGKVVRLYEDGAAVFASRTYRSWVSMRQRCTDPNATSYESYGGRGINVCERWNVFTNFLADMGERPLATTLDRVDVDGDYCPENCQWADLRTQNWNRRHLIYIEAFGERKRLVEWLEDARCLATPTALRARLSAGWAAERALSTEPKRQRTVQ